MDELNNYIPDDIVNNISINNAILKKIISGNPPTECSETCLVTLLADMAHDKLSTENKTTPSDLENNIVSETKIDSLDKQIVEILSNYGECVVYAKNKSDGHAYIPYRIPDNSNNCFIRDCFAGKWIPGLNNIFDQASSSLGEFIKFHSGKGEQLKNPLFESSPGGIGQQLTDKRLKFTAYFNYDLLLFLYITTDIKPIIQPIVTKVQQILNDNNENKLSPNEILLINTVNINFVWCWLMIYCKKSVEEDQYYKNQADKKNGFIEALNALTQIRFDSFDINNDGYISNPFFLLSRNP